MERRLAQSAPRPPHGLSASPARVRAGPRFRARSPNRVGWLVCLIGLVMSLTAACATGQPVIWVEQGVSLSNYHAVEVRRVANDTGQTLREYVWLDDMPLAVIADVDTATPKLFFVHADHIDRPVRMTDGAQAVVWDAVFRPFGAVQSITGSATNNLRFPGQYFLIESGLHYNWHRHYDPTIGRYLQADPLEFVNGPSLFAYALSSPLNFSDPTGLQSFPPPPPSVPGGPWTWTPDPLNSRGGTYRDPAGRSCSWDARGNHWDVDYRGERQRYDRWGTPLSASQAHGYRGPRQGPIWNWPTRPMRPGGGGGGRGSDPTFQ